MDRRTASWHRRGIVWSLCIRHSPVRVWVRTLNGKALLREAEFTRKVAVLEAQARLSSSVAEAEIIRAEGVSKANKIIGESLKNNPGYLQYLWITKARTTATEPCT